MHVYYALQMMYSYSDYKPSLTVHAKKGYHSIYTHSSIDVYSNTTTHVLSRHLYTQRHLHLKYTSSRVHRQDFTDSAPHNSPSNNITCSGGGFTGGIGTVCVHHVEGQRESPEEAGSVQHEALQGLNNYQEIEERVLLLWSVCVYEEGGREQYDTPWERGATVAHN